MLCDSIAIFAKHCKMEMRIFMAGLCFFMTDAVTSYQAAEIHTTWTTLEKNIEVVCPGASICTSNTSSTVAAVEIPAGFTPCCKDCSCDIACEETDSCCFPEREVYKKTKKQKQQCLFTVTKNEPNLYQKSADFASYLMVADNPAKDFDPESSVNEINARAQNNQSANCGSEKVKFWGSLSPVFSRKSGLIYKNAVCADRYGVKDGVNFSASLVCDFSNKEMNNRVRDISANLKALEPNGVMPKYCYVSLSYPGKKADLKTRRCFKHVVDKCSDSKIVGIDDINITKQEIMDACVSGLRSIYRRSYLEYFYANVFCYACNGNTGRYDRFCNEAANFRGYTDEVSILKLIDSNDIYTSEASQTAFPRKQLACEDKGLITTKSHCRVLLCPSGQIRNVNGTCLYPVLTLGATRYRLQLILVPEEPIVVTNGKLMELYTSRDISWLVSPWPKKWNIRQILTENEPNENGCKIVKIIVQMVLHSKLSSQIILNDIKKYLKEFWHSQINSFPVSAEQHISNLYGFSKTHILNQLPRLTPLWLVRLDLAAEAIPQGMKSPNITEMYSYSDVNKLYISISKMFFCNQIELNISEFTLLADRSLLFYKKNSTYLHEGEFVLIDNDLDNITSRICLSDSGLTVQTVANLCPGTFISKWLGCIVLLGIVH